MKRQMYWLMMVLVLMMALAACGGSKAITVSEVPAYPEATALQPGDDPVADTLAQNTQQDASLRANMGVGGSTEQMAYRLPAGATWDQVKSFYDEKLQADGWTSGMGGPGGDLASDILASANQGNDLFQTAMWSRDKQVLSVIRTADPLNAEAQYLIFSLTTNP